MAASVTAVPGWSQYPWLKAGFSTRQGGATTVYGGTEELNLGWTKEDPAEVVAANRAWLLAAVAGAGTPLQLVTMRQVHGAVVSVIARPTSSLATADGRATLECDGLATSEAGLWLGVQTADCVPILLADTRTRAVAALHAGWRGTLAGIAGQGVQTMQQAFGSDPADLVAAIGPAILKCCFAVGDEVYESFTREYRYGEELFTRADDGPRHMDLHAANRRQLEDAGLRAESIELLPECTVGSRLDDGRRRYFSHRAEKGVTGRMMSLIGVSETLA